MVEPEDLLGKADALMARHRPARAGAEPYGAIPVLEEVVELPAEGDDLPVLTELVEPDMVETEPVQPIQPEHWPVAPVLIEPALVEPEPVPPGLPQEDQSEALAASIRASLLAALQPEIDTLIEERLKVSLEPLVVKLFEDLRGDLQAIARGTLSDAIHTAVERELERRKTGD